MTKENPDIWEIYKIYNTINDKVYIGQTKQGFEVRFAKHKRRKNNECPKLYNAFNKHNRENFFVEALMSCKTQEAANYYEELLIKEYNSVNCGYNIDEKAQCGPMCLETRRKISEARKGTKVSDETKIKLSLAFSGERNPMYGKSHTEETKNKISIANTNHKHTEEWCLKQSERLKGVKFTEEHKQNMRKPKSEEHRRKISEARKGKPRSEETRKKLSEAKRGKKLSEETKLKIRIAKIKNKEKVIHE